MLAKIADLVEELNSSGIRYCHWKSNIALAESVSGQTDIDLLVHRQDAPLFRNILTQLCFRPVRNADGKPFPSVEHHFSIDDASGELVHVHAYYRVITGESLTKNYRLPVEEMLLQNTRLVGPIPVPTRSAELVIYTVRMMMKHTSLVELALLSRNWKQVPDEADWLSHDETLDEALNLVSCWLPVLDVNLFARCFAALKAPAPLFTRIRLGFRLRSQLGTYARYSGIRSRLTGIRKFLSMGYRRLTHSKKGLMPLTGGAVIAFVGSEATGKSTLLAEMRGWLGEHLTVRQIHAGKPKPTFLSVVPNALVPALRSMFPTHRSGHVEAQYYPEAQDEASSKQYSLFFGVRSALLAYDRRSLLTRAYGQAANGTIILCDRYPSLQSGAPDSPQLSHLPVASNGNSVRRLLARIEARLYQEIPPPDLVIYLSAPLDVTVSRNASRGKREPEDYVRLRHARTSNLEFGKTPVYRINTDQSLEKTVLETKRVVWNAL